MMAKHHNKKIRVLIADDEPLAREAIRLRLQGYEEFQVIDEADNGNDAVLLIRTLVPDAVFMDINMPKMSGLEAAQHIISVADPCLVFITAFEQHALRAFRLNALDYITKPINDDAFGQVVEKIKRQVIQKRAQQTYTEEKQSTQHSGYLKRIAIKEQGEINLFDTRDIESVTSVKDYLCIKINGKVHIQRQTMRQIASLLDPDIFIRCHRSHLVNLHFVTRWLEADGATYLLCNEERHPVSRRYRATVKTLLEKHK